MNIDTCAVIVTYNPDINLFTQQVESLKGQCSILVVDNSEDPDTCNNIGNKCGEFGIKFVSMGGNTGIAKAQNTGIALAINTLPGCEYILLLDQDSIPPVQFVSSLRLEYQSLCKVRAVAVLGSSLYDPRAGDYHGFHRIKGLAYTKVKPNEINTGSIPCTTVNSSGSFFATKAFEDVGGFDEGLFIDHVETEWCFRAKKRGYELYATNKVELEHFMGDDVLVYSVLGKKKFMPYRSPLRHRYLFRNSIALLKRDYVPFIWKFYCLIKLTYTCFVFSLFSNEKLDQLKAICLGARDGVIGRKGKIK